MIMQRPLGLEFEIVEQHRDMTIHLFARGMRSWGGWRYSKTVVLAPSLMHPDGLRQAVEYEAKRLHEDYVREARQLQATHRGRHL